MRGETFAEDETLLDAAEHSRKACELIDKL